MRDCTIYGYGLEDVGISEHAFTRMKERNGWSKKAAKRMVGRIYDTGLKPDQVKGYLKSWIQGKAEYDVNGNEFRLYGEKLYIFKDRIMLTVLPTPSRTLIQEKRWA